MSDRDRDPAGRPRNARPRDATGRPLPRGETGVEPVPETSRTVPDALAEAQRLLDDGRPFGAHEVLEGLWKETTEPRHRALWRGLAQLMVGLTHAQRGNRAGAESLLRRGTQTLAEAGPVPEVDVDGWLRWCAEATAAGSAGHALPVPPRLARE